MQTWKDASGVMRFGFTRTTSQSIFGYGYYLEKYIK